MRPLPRLFALLSMGLLVAPLALTQTQTDEKDEAFWDDPFATEEPTPGTESQAPETENGPETGGGNAAETNADEFLEFDSVDDLFGSEEIISDAEEPDAAYAPEDDLLLTDGITWRGSVRGRVSMDWSWEDVWTEDFGILDPSSQSLSPTVGGSLSFDARPDREFRAYGRINIDSTTDGQLDLGDLSTDPDSLAAILPEGFVAVENEDGDTEVQTEDGTVLFVIAAEEQEQSQGDAGTAPGLDIEVFELFSDFTYQDLLFFRFGKHTIQWGTGYFFSPADVLNLTSVDPEDPTAERQGPISLRVLYPFGVTGNAYLYLITNALAEPLDVAIAPKIEFAVGNGEISLAGYYQRTLSPRLIGLYTVSVGDVDLFAEGVGLLGADRVFVRPSRDQSAAQADLEDDYDLVVESYEVKNAVFGQLTVGGRYLKEWDGGTSLLLVGQYLFNGTGYDNSEPQLLPAATRLLLNPDENGLALPAEEQPEGYSAPPALGTGDLVNWGRHYAGATLGFSSILDSNIGITLFGLMNLTDLSGIVTPAISYSFLDRFTATGSARFTFGQSTDEFTDPAALFTGADAEPTFGLTLDISMPGGRF